jgi:hypothetical protein
MMHLASASKNNRWPIFGHCYRQIQPYGNHSVAVDTIKRVQTI